MLLARLVSLPDTSALAASVQDVPRGWGVDRHAAVTIVDALQQNTWVTVKAAGGRARRPKLVTRPNARRHTDRRVVSVAELSRAKTSEGE